MFRIWLIVLVGCFLSLPAQGQKDPTHKTQTKKKTREDKQRPRTGEPEPKERGKPNNSTEPQDAFRLGLMEVQQGNCAEASRYFQEFRALSPTDERLSEVNDQLKKCETLNAGIELYGTKKFGAAREAFAKARDADPQWPPPLRWLGRLDARVGNCSEAIEYFQTFLKLAKPDDNYVSKVNDWLKECKKLQPGIELYNAKACPVPKSCIDLYKPQEWQQVQQVFQKVSSEDPQWAPPYLWLGRVSMQLDDCAQADAHFQKFKQLSPENEYLAEVNDRLKECEDLGPGIKWYKTRNWKMAQKMFEQVKNKDPQWAPPYRWLGRVEVELCKHDDAIDHFRDFLRRAELDDEYRCAVNGLINQCQRKPVKCRPWIWAVIAGSAVVVAGGVAGAVEGSRPPTPTLGSIDF